MSMDDGNVTVSNRGWPLPPGLEHVFSCTRAVIFHDPTTTFPSIAGTGFLLQVFGEIFFITARHVVDNEYNYPEENLTVFYRPDYPLPIPFSEIRRYTSLDPDDTDHVDIVMLKVDSEKVDKQLFGKHQPFKFDGKMFVQNYRPGDRLYFSGFSPSTSELDYENERYDIHFAAGDLIYARPSTLRSVHVAKADVHRSSPDFDGLSGSPVFHIESVEDTSSYVEFGGMLLRGTRTSEIFHFLDAYQTFHYVLDYFLGGLSEVDAMHKLGKLISWHHPDIKYDYRDEFSIRAKSTIVRLLNGRVINL